MLNKKELFIFDMDGVLLDSEPYWRQAQVELLSEFKVTITVEDCIRYTMGKRIDDISKYWIARFNLDIPQQRFSDLLLKRTAILISANAQAREGIYQLIDLLTRHGIRIALATSSSRPIIAAVMDKLHLDDVFELTLSADTVVNGKPFPDIYLKVCQQLNVTPDKALALEDSLTGVTAAVRAQITTIAIPEKRSAEFDIADHVVENIQDVIEIVSGLYLS